MELIFFKGEEGETNLDRLRRILSKKEEDKEVPLAHKPDYQYLAEGEKLNLIHSLLVDEVNESRNFRTSVLHTLDLMSLSSVATVERLTTVESTPPRSWRASATRG